MIRRFRRPLAAIAVAVAADLAVRVGSGFDMGVVVPFEAALFLVLAVTLAGFRQRGDADDPRARILDAWLATVFALAGIRSLLWALGLDVSIANLVILVLGVAAGTWAWRRRRR